MNPSIAAYYGTTAIYWSAVIIVLGVAAGFLLSYSIYTAHSGRGTAMLVLLPFTLLFGVLLSRAVHFYCNQEQYGGLWQAMTEYSSGSFWLPGAAANGGNAGRLCVTKVNESAPEGAVNEIGRICHKHFPGIPLQIGNTSASVGAVAVPLRGGAKEEYYDLVGMEIPSQTIVPERLIEVGLLGQNVAKAVGKKMTGRDFRTGGCLEFVYRSDRDLGADGERLMAEWHMRDLVISLMNGYTLASPAELFDCTTGYCNTIWGVVGLVRRVPFAYPKLAYLAYAVLTKALDGVKFVREIPTGSTTVYAAEFLRKDGLYATAFWCARGEADLVCDARGELWTMEGRRSSVGGWFSDAKFTCSGAPCYLISKKPCASVTIAGRNGMPAANAFIVAVAPVAAFFKYAVTAAPDVPSGWITTA